MDPITDLLNRIKNAQIAQHAMVEVLHSNLKYEILKVMEKNNLIDKVAKSGKKNNKTLEITLKYTDKTPAITGLRRVSKQGQRIYVSANQIKQVRGGYGIAIISTSRGLMTGGEARKQRLGGEIICEIW
jgi:small subunit ribosomal protein S8